MTRPRKNPGARGFEPGIFRSRGGLLTTRPTRRSPPAEVAIFKAHQAIVQLFYQAVIQNAIFFNLIYFFSNAKKGDTGRLEKITRTAGEIMTADPLSPSDIFQRAAFRKLSGLQADTSHPLHGVVQSCAPARDSSRRLRSLKSWARS